jgi:MOSC domain-containing protein YiiM
MGRLIGIAKAPIKLSPMEELDTAMISVEDGIVGDARGRNTDRQVTILFRESWEATCSELGANMRWTIRRANLFVEGVPTPRPGARMRVGEVLLEVTKETKPCHVMEASWRGLKTALQPEWRGGVCCNVIRGGRISIGDMVWIT